MDLAGLCPTLVTYGAWASGPGLAVVFSSLHHPALKRLHTFPLDHSPIDRFSLSSAFTFDFVIAFSFTSPPSIFSFKKVCVCAQLLSRVRLSVIPWTVAHQAPLYMEFFRQEYWSGLPFPSPGDLPDPGIKSASLVSPALAGRSFTTEPLGKLR